MRYQPALAAAVLATALVPLSARASTPLYWDTNDITTPGAGSPANGTWDTATYNWNNDPTGAAAGLLTPWPADGSSTDAVFSAGTDAIATNTVVVNGALSANSLTFEEGTLRLNGVAPANPGDPLTSSLSLGPGGMTIVKGTPALAAPNTDANLKLVVAADQTWTMSGIGSFTTFNGPVQFDHTLTLTRSTTANNANFVFKNAAGTGSGTVFASGTSNAVTIQIGANPVLDASNNLLSGPVGTGTIKLAGGRLSSLSATAAFTVANPVEIAGSSAIGGQSNTGALTFTNSLTIDAGSAKTLTLDSGSNATTNSQSLTFNGPVSLLANATLSTNTNNSTTINGDISDDSASTSVAKSLTKTGAGSLTLAGNNTYTGATTVSNGTLNLASTFLSPAPLTLSSGTTVKLTTANTTLRTASLTLNGTAKLDLGSSLLVLNSGADPATLNTYLAAGRNAGAWNAPSGLTTSAPMDPLHAIGYAPASAINASSWGAATSLTGTETLLSTTYLGDLNLDGTVNADDYARLDRAYATNQSGGSLAGWSNGDLNYDNTIDANDYLLIDTTYLSLHPAAAPTLLADRQSQFGDAYVQTLLTSIPEPTSLTASGLAALPLVTRRRHHRSAPRT